MADAGSSDIDNLDEQLHDVDVRLSSVDDEIARLQTKRSRLKEKRQKLIELKERNEFQKLTKRNWGSNGKYNLRLIVDCSPIIAVSKSSVGVSLQLASWLAVVWLNYYKYY